MAFRILVDRHHQERLAEAEENRLAASIERTEAAAIRPSETRAKIGQWLVRAGESLGGEPVRRRA